jgi:hypothetical protein
MKPGILEHLYFNVPFHENRFIDGYNLKYLKKGKLEKYDL